MPTIQHPDFFCSQAVPFDERHEWKAAGFTFNASTREWETRNPFVAQKMIEFHPTTRGITIDYHPKLLPYQVDGVQQVARKLLSPYSDFYCLADEMGLGKTPQALQVAACIGVVTFARVAIICLANSRKMWFDHLYGNFDHKPNPIERWGGGLADRPCDVLYSGVKEQIHSNNHLICSYSLAAKVLLGAGNFDFIILDEIQALGSPDTKQTFAVLEFCKRQVAGGAKVLGLTGTWLKNCPIEIWPILHAIGPQFFKDMSYKDFAYRYCQPWRHPKTGRLIVEGFKNTEELQYNLRALCMTRREVKEVRGDLPDPIFSHVQLEHKGEELEQKLKAEHEIYEYLEKVKGIMKLKPGVNLKLGEYSRIRKELAEYKAPIISKYIRRKVMPTLDKVCVFCHTVYLAKYIEEELKDFGAVRITGETPAKKRDEIVERFQTDPECRVFVGNIQAAGVAITLTAASTLLFAEASWVPGDNDQVIGRLRRHGQTEQVHVKFVVLRGSLDEKILAKAYWKKGGIAKVLNKEK